MKKILTVSALAVTVLMLVIPFGTGANRSDFNYSANPIAIQVSPNGMSPDGLPLCRSASLVNIVCYSPSFIRAAYQYPSPALLYNTLRQRKLSEHQHQLPKPDT